MKLIRLQTDDDNCVFDNTFNAELKIKKGSKIALKNICINKEPGNVSLLGSASDDVVYNTIGVVIRSPGHVSHSPTPYPTCVFPYITSLHLTSPARAHRCPTGYQ